MHVRVYEMSCIVFSFVVIYITNFVFRQTQYKIRWRSKGGYGSSLGVPKELASKGIDVGVSLLFLKCV